MADIASPASDPRSLRRHYPHQVQGVRLTTDVSAIAAPPHCNSKLRPAFAKSKTSRTTDTKEHNVQMTPCPSWTWCEEDRPSGSDRITARLSLALRWCGKSPARRCPLFSRPI